MPQQIAHQQVEMVRIDLIDVLNPRERGRLAFGQMTRNVEAIGLKRPVTVSRRPQTDGSLRYALICGQGRLEIFRALGQAEIPAFVTDVRDDDCMVMSLVENVARRRHSSAELVQEIANLQSRGFTSLQISDRIGMSKAWVAIILSLLEKGETKLIEGVESGVIPLNLAVSISRSSEAGIQHLLTEAYESGALRGKKLGMVRRLLDKRSRRKAASNSSDDASRTNARSMTPDQLNALYEQVVGKQRMLAKNAAYTHETLLFITQALRELVGNVDFRQLLHRVGLQSMPRILAIEPCEEVER